LSEKLTRALDAFDADALASKHGGYKESRNPRSFEWLIPCPLCGSDRLRWHHEAREKQAWICWGCRATGDTIYLVQLLEQCSEMDALGYVLDGYVGGDAPVALTEIARTPITVSAARLTVPRLPSIQWPAGVELLAPQPRHARGWMYLHNARGIPPGDAIEWRVGFGVRGRLKDYVVFPIFMDGALVYWQGRACWDPPSHLISDQRREWKKATSYRKTLNPIAREGEARAGDVLLNYDRAKTAPHVVVCEGPIDAMRVGAHAVALLGKVPSPMKVERLLRMHARRYTVYLDPGAEEAEAAESLAGELSGFAPTFIAIPPAGLDPGDLTPEQNAAVIAQGRPWRGAALKSDLRIR